MSEHPHLTVFQICASVGFPLAKGDSAKIYALAKSEERSAIYEVLKSMDFDPSPAVIRAIEINSSIKLNSMERKELNKKVDEQARIFLKDAVRDAEKRHPDLDFGYFRYEPQTSSLLPLATMIARFPMEGWEAALRQLNRKIDAIVVERSPFWLAAKLVKVCVKLARAADIVLVGGTPTTDEIVKAGNDPNAWLETARDRERGALRRYATKYDVRTAEDLLDILSKPIETDADLDKFGIIERYKSFFGRTVKFPGSDIDFVLRLLKALDAKPLPSVRDIEDLVAARRMDEKRSETARRDARRAKADWEASLMNAPDARKALGVKPTEFARWIGDGRIPVAKTVKFYKWGKSLEAKLHDPIALREVKDEIPKWREDDLVTKKEAWAAARALKNPPKTEEETSLLTRVRSLMKSSGRTGVTPVLESESIFVRAKITHDLFFPDATVFKATAEATHIFELPAEAYASVVDKPVLRSKRADAIETLVAVLDPLIDACRANLDGVIATWGQRVAMLTKSYSQDARERFEAILLDRWKEAGWKANRKGESPTDIARRLMRALVDVLTESTHVFDEQESTYQVRVRSGMTDFPALFPMARAMKRRLILNVGPTNSGKTHAAIDAFAKAGSGIYAAPLRLMALEAHERMIEERNIPCSMITGEERVLVEGARHVACTIEMSDLSSPVDVAVIDEVQMLRESDRGWAWTAAVMGIPAATVIMTGSPDAIEWVEAIASMTGEILEIRRFERKTPLTAMEDGIHLEHITKGDAIIAFSRSEVMRLRETLIEMGRKVAVVYGALGPEVRRAEAKRFREGDADILIATDAIGMGLNLPCRRVIFSELSKFDGRESRRLTASEIRQIAGRAGRFGHHESGMAGVFMHENPKAITAALNLAPERPDDLRPFVMPPLAAIREISENLETQELHEILRYFAETVLAEDEFLRAPDMETVLAISEAIDYSGLDLATKAGYLGAPIEMKTGIHAALLSSWSLDHAEGKPILAPKASIFKKKASPDTDEQLRSLEDAVKELTLYIWLALRWPGAYTEHAEAEERRKFCNGLIEESLRQKALNRTCSECRNKLPKDHKFPVCEPCFQSRRRSRWGGY